MAIRDYSFTHLLFYSSSLTEEALLFTECASKNHWCTSTHIWFYSYLITIKRHYTICKSHFSESKWPSEARTSYNHTIITLYYTNSIIHTVFSLTLSEEQIFFSLSRNLTKSTLRRMSISAPPKCNIWVIAQLCQFLHPSITSQITSVHSNDRGQLTAFISSHRQLAVAIEEGSASKCPLPDTATS